MSHDNRRSHRRCRDAHPACKGQLHSVDAKDHDKKKKHQLTPAVGLLGPRMEGSESDIAVKTIPCAGFKAWQELMQEHVLPRERHALSHRSRSIHEQRNRLSLSRNEEKFATARDARWCVISILNRVAWQPDIMYRICPTIE